MFVDADHAGERDHCRSTSGMYLVLAGPRGTFVPLAWFAKKQGATSRSTTEAEMIALLSALFSEARPTLGLLESAIKEGSANCHVGQSSNHHNPQERVQPEV